MAKLVKRKCAECTDVISGRPDKRFCSDNCRVSHNNKLNRDSTTLMRNINNTLRRNRRILKALNPKGKTKLSRMILADQGFNFHYYTNTYKTKAGKTYFFCYDQGYLPLEKDQLALVVRKDYVK